MKPSLPIILFVKRKEGSEKAAYYSGRITFAKILKAYAASIITSFLNPPSTKVVADVI